MIEANGAFAYLSYPFSFMIAIVKIGMCVQGSYRYLEADQFESEGTLEFTRNLMYADMAKSWPCKKELKYPRTCESCANDCGNVHCCGDCCDYESMAGLP